ncbi:MAG: VTT domain-containing protein [Hyphomonadaceae bacterium]
MMASRKRTAWLLALPPALGNIVGGLIMYWLGAVLAEPVIDPMIAWMGAQSDYSDALDMLREDGFWALMIVGVTPFPFQVGTAAAGVAGYPLLPFVLAVGLSRSIRYLALVALVRVVGAQAREWIERRQLEIFGGGIVLFVMIGLAVWLS